jgi:rare lipoprotein A
MSKMRACIVSIALIGAATVPTVNSAKADQVGHASWYALHSRTASGARMNPSAMTAAHRSLPFGTKVLVENLSNGRSAVVTINDRGPFVQGRISVESGGLQSRNAGLWHGQGQSEHNRWQPSCCHALWSANCRRLDAKHSQTDTNGLFQAPLSWCSPRFSIRAWD